MTASGPTYRARYDTNLRIWRVWSGRKFIDTLGEQKDKPSQREVEARVDSINSGQCNDLITFLYQVHLAPIVEVDCPPTHKDVRKALVENGLDLIRAAGDDYHAFYNPHQLLEIRVEGNLVDKKRRRRGR